MRRTEWPTCSLQLTDAYDTLQQLTLTSWHCGKVEYAMLRAMHMQYIEYAYAMQWIFDIGHANPSDHSPLLLLLTLTLMYIYLPYCSLLEMTPTIHRFIFSFITIFHSIQHNKVYCLPILNLSTYLCTYLYFYFY